VPAIRAAFVAFHRNAGLIAPLPRRLGGGALAFSALALVGLAGGLFLAFFCFNTPEKPITIAASPPELIYTRPTATADEIPQFPPAGSREFENHFASLAQHAPGVVSADDASNERSRHEAAGDDDANTSELVIAQSSLPQAIENFAAAQRLGLTTGGVAHNGGNSLDAGYDAEELPTIPEPATGGIVAAGVAMLIAGRRISATRRRR
jgi:hypothetical protein